ncbi:hypothetical protein TNCV_1860141 [Trichonephila clavipes]|nr:hypothetical protein TNCV_1860141 [Trichonephila clavipes]
MLIADADTFILHKNGITARTSKRDQFPCLFNRPEPSRNFHHLPENQLSAIRKAQQKGHTGYIEISDGSRGDARREVIGSNESHPCYLDGCINSFKWDNVDTLSESSEFLHVAHGLRSATSSSGKGLDSNLGEGMSVNKRTVPLRHDGTQNSRRTASPLVRWVEREERWKAPCYE